MEVTDADFHGTPPGWAIHGSDHGWSCNAGDYAATVEALLKAGAKVPDVAEGTEPVREVLHRYGAMNQRAGAASEGRSDRFEVYPECRRDRPSRRPFGGRVTTTKSLFHRTSLTPLQGGRCPSSSNTRAGLLARSGRIDRRTNEKGHPLSGPGKCGWPQNHSGKCGWPQYRTTLGQRAEITVRPNGRFSAFRGVRCGSMGPWPDPCGSRRKWQGTVAR